MTLSDRNIKAADGERIGRIIRERRKTMALSVGATAKKSGLSRVSVWQIEAGRVRPLLMTVALLCSALDMDLSELLVLESSP